MWRAREIPTAVRKEVELKQVILDQQDQPSTPTDDQANDSSDNPSQPPVSTPALPPTIQSPGSNNTTIPSDSVASLFNHSQIMDRNITSEFSTSISTQINVV